MDQQGANNKEWAWPQTPGRTKSKYKQKRPCLTNRESLKTKDGKWDRNQKAQSIPQVTVYAMSSFLQNTHSKLTRTFLFPDGSGLFSQGIASPNVFQDNGQMS